MTWLDKWLYNGQKRILVGRSCPRSQIGFLKDGQLKWEWMRIDVRTADGMNHVWADIMWNPPSHHVFHLKLALRNFGQGLTYLCASSYLTRLIASLWKMLTLILPLIEGIFSYFLKARFIACLKAKGALWGMNLDIASEDNATFTVPGRPFYQLVTMPFGLHCTPDNIMTDGMTVISIHLLLTTWRRAANNTDDKRHWFDITPAKDQIRYTQVISLDCTDPDKIQAITDVLGRKVVW